MSARRSSASARLDLPGLSDLTRPRPAALLPRHPRLSSPIAMVPATAWFLNKSRAGLVLRAVGDSHEAAHAIGYP